MAKIEMNVVSVETVNSEVMTPQIIKELEEYFLSDNFRQMDVSRIKRSLWELTYDPIDTFACSFKPLNSLVADSNSTERRILVIRDEIYRQYCKQNKYLSFWVRKDNRLNIDYIANSIVFDHVEKTVEKLPAQDILVICSMLRNGKKHNVQYGALRKLHFSNLESNYLDSIFTDDAFFDLANIIEEKLSEKQVAADNSNSQAENAEKYDIENAAPVPVVEDTTAVLEEVDIPTDTEVEKDTSITEEAPDPSDIISFIKLSDELSDTFDLEDVIKHQKEIKQFLVAANVLDELYILPDYVLSCWTKLEQFFKYSALFNK